MTVLSVVLLNHSDDRNFQSANLRRVNFIDRICKVQRAIVVNRELSIDLDVLALLHAAREAAEERPWADHAKPRGLGEPFIAGPPPDAGLHAQCEHGESIIRDSVR